ncbi:hypothetical protein PENFLA_c066G00483 [Penicillium flavigenum]|uniref:Succinate-semialdehyde dehydrogenase, mitochondrial n=2 Tax=Penicillium TaxID=5073 RepID=A0A1V6SE08_9EURO|nr:hypothetical protein N7530_008670 [Penicillium desertorum]OQE11989.1 hypothetical protein PENFLA_c066G00483 [Penicillium flavigenum]
MTNDFPVTLSEPSLLGSNGLVAGQWRLSSSRKTFPVYEPSTGNVLHHCADMGNIDFVQAIESAHTGFLEFSTSTTAKSRGILLRKWYELILKHQNDLAKILSLENGKTLVEAQGEVIYASSFVSWFAEEASRSYGDTIPSSTSIDNTIITFKEPVGPCAIITPWNFPAAMITRKIAPAFAAGCSVVIKPPSETPFSALAFAKLALEAGIPADCLHVLPTKDHAASEELMTNPLIKKISFTGSTKVGKYLTKLAAGTMKRVSMELGGNAPFIVFDDADLDLAVEGAMVCKFRCSGQTCVCANRLLVHESVVDRFTAKLCAKVKALRLGRGIDEGITQGPLVNSAAVKKISAHVHDALSKGAVLHAGGKTPEHLQGYFYEPTVVTGVTTSMEVAYDETFGPLAAIFTFSSEEEAVALANDTEFGLAGYFFSKDISRVLRVAKLLQCGMIGVNTGLISAAEAPFGGIKESGVGREGSKYGLAEYQNIKSITIGNTGLRT